MATADPDLKLRVEWDEARQAFVDAKKTRGKNPETYAKAKKRMRDLRVRWREVGEATGTRTPGASAVDNKE